jgi:hypothetical protein
MKKLWIMICTFGFIIIPPNIYAKKTRKRVVYKKYEKFDFEEIKLQGEVAAPGDLSVMTRFQRRFRNKLPYKTSFNPEIKRSLKRIK